MGRSFDGRAFRKLKAALRRERRQPCWLCRQPIDYALPSEHPDSFSADHVLPVATHPELALVYSNLDAAHLDCNKRRQDKMPAPGLGDAAGQW
jgi:5-methylcytosine-specific restriction endonuclease McrA